MKAASSAAKVAGCLLGLAWSIAVWAADPVATVENVVGTLSARTPDGPMRIVSQGSRIAVGEILATEADSSANLKFTDGTRVAIRPNSRMVIDRFRYAIAQPEQDSSAMSLAKGGMRTVTGLIAKRNPQAFETRTPVTSIGIRGTDYALTLCAGSDPDCARVKVPVALLSGDRLPLPGLYLSVFEGAINAANNAGNRNFAAGKHGYVRDADTLPVEFEEDPNLLREYLGFHGLGSSINPFDAGPEVCLVK